MLVFFSNFFLILSLLLLIVILFLFLTTIKVNVKYKNNNYVVIIKLYLFGFLRYLKFQFNKEKIKKIFDYGKNTIERKSNNRIENKIYKDRKIIKNILTELKINLEYLKLNLNIGTEFILLTSVIITTLSTIFPMILNKVIKKYDAKKYSYNFNSIYNKNDFNLELDCIISIKLVHIINVILSILFKKGVFKNVRSSNTRFNDNCYE